MYGTSPGSYSSSVDVGSTTAYSIASLTSGTRYYFAVRAYNTSGVSGPLSSEVSEVAADAPPIDTTPPGATMTGPAGGAQVSGSITLAATATDNVAVAGVTFRVDGAAAGPEDTTAPYTLTWNTVGAANGSHALTAVARDAAGNLGTSPVVTVQVLNDVTPPVVLTLTPAANASNVSGTTAVTASFSEALDPSSVSAAAFELRTATTSALVAAAVSYNAATKTATLLPGSPLAPGASFNATIKGGSAGVRDVAGNRLAANTLWSFTVAPLPPPGSGLMAAYGFEEGTGTIAADASGNGNPGTISGAAWTPGKFGSSLQFDGLSNRVTVAAGSDVNLTASLTIEAWVNPTSLTGWRTVMMKETGTGLAYALYANDNEPKPATYVRLTGASFSAGSSGAMQLPLNTWTHLAATFDGSFLNLFVGGVLVQSQPASGSVTTSSGALYLGGNAIWGEYFAGRIDEVRLYNRALSASEIQADMSRPIATSNRVPVVTSPGSQTGTEGVAVSALAIGATDPDGDALTYSASGLPAGLSIHAGTGVISGTVGFTATASNTVVVTVNDGHGATASTAPFAWTITLVNRAPTVTTPGPQTGTKGVAVAPLAMSAADPDGDALTYSATGLPSGVTINAATGVISGTVGAGASASNAVGVIVTDGHGGSATANFSWTIAATVPVIVAVTPAANATDVPAASAVTAAFSADIDASSISAATFSLRTSANALVAGGLSYDTATKTATLAPSSALASSGSFTATVTGGPAGVRDLAGTPLAANVSWTFTVASESTPGTGLVAAYGFDEGLGTVTADQSGLGNAATIAGAAWKVGRFGKSLGFDGISNWVTVAASPSVNLTGAMTIEAWVYPTEAAGWRTVVFKEAPGQTWAHDYALYSTFGDEGPGGHVLTGSQANAHDPAAIALNRWTHLATTYDGQMLRSYVNGIERAAVAATGTIDVSDGALRIGGNGMFGDFFKGRIDEVRLYNRALPAAQIQADMATPVTGWLAAAYSFDDGMGSTVKDDAGRFLTGTIVGATWTAAGRFGGGLRFDGLNDYVTVADSSWLALNQNMTLEAWVYPTAPGGWRTVMMKQSVDWYTFALYSNGSVGPGVRAMALSDGNATSPALLPINAWSHLAATYDGTTLELFVNGVSVASTPFTANLSTSTDPLSIGGNNVFGEYFAGIIDEVRIYYRKLSVPEIGADMNRRIR